MLSNLSYIIEIALINLFFLLILVLFLIAIIEKNNKEMNFEYICKDKSGKEVKGTINNTTTTEAAELLLKKYQIVISLKPIK